MRGLKRQRAVDLRLGAEPQLHERLADGDPAQERVLDSGLRLVGAEDAEIHQELAETLVLEARRHRHAHFVASAVPGPGLRNSSGWTRASGVFLRVRALSRDWF